MQTNLPQSLLDDPRGAEADRILRSCVHCGFCNAACPTYGLFGDELDGPRGRIYQIKQMLEGAPAGAATRLHLDRCLTCRACETTCPSGVDYNRLLEIGRERIESILERPRGERILRRLLLAVMVNPTRVRWALRLARYARVLLSQRLVNALPKRLTAAHPPWPAARHSRRVIALEGCVQAVTHQHIDSAAARVLDRSGVSLVRVSGGGCCGAAAHHLAEPRRARELMRRNIDAWWPHIEQGAEAIMSSSSACGLMLRDYGRLLADDPAYRDKAARVSSLVRDMSEILSAKPTSEPPHPQRKHSRVAFHAPCSLQHGLRRHGEIEALLKAQGFEFSPVSDAHLCCGAAGTYAVFQAGISERLGEQKVEALERNSPDVIATANIGCLIHLEKRARVPVRHWIELIDEAESS